VPAGWAAMSQRRLPSGQGPARGAVRASAGPRPASQRGRTRRPVERTSRGEPLPRPASRSHHAADEARASGSPRSGLRRTGGPARRIRAPRLPRRISARTATLVLLLLALAFAYAYPVRVYLAQQAEIDRLEQAQSEQRQRIQELTDQLKRWDDEQFVISEARRRLHYVREGELVYVVGTDPTGDVGDVANGADSVWFSQLWSSVQAVDNPPVP
jgi:cell division protein FtsB